MSDDDEYYEWDEEYSLEDLVPDLVDELAATSYYEAALYEDPAAEAEEFFSDWEYYSDDYYDDDPTAAKSIAGEKGIDAVTTTAAAPKPRGTRPAPRTNRGLPRAKSSPNLDLASFQGVVWKTPSLEKDQDVPVQIYEPGRGDKVALLGNWHEIFKSSQPVLDKSRLRKRRAVDSRRPGTSPAGDGIPGGGDERHDSSDRMSDVVRENGDPGDVSNTTSELAQSPSDMPNPTVAPSPKRGRKRKAEVSAENSNKNRPHEGSTQPRPKRVASRKGDGEGGVSRASSGPERRSTRAKK